MEQCDLTTPAPYPPPGPATANWKVDELHFLWTARKIEIILRGENGERRNVSYQGDIAAALMTALNVANLSVKSLHRRVIERLIADGHLAGTISGSPDGA